MSRENVEIIRANLAAYNDRDTEAMLRLWHPEGEWFSAGAGNVEDHVYRGHPSVREYFDDIAETWDENAISDCEYRDLDGNRVIVFGQIHMRGQASGINVDQPIFLVYEIRDGMIFRGHSYLDRAEALAAAGLADEVTGDVEIVRAAIEAFSRGERDSALAAMAPDVEFVGGGGTAYRGHAGVRKLETLLREAFDEIRIEPDEFRQNGELVLVLGRVSVRGRGSGAAAKSRRGWVATLRDGQITRIQTYDDQAEALEAAGLSE